MRRLILALLFALSGCPVASPAPASTHGQFAPYQRGPDAQASNQHASRDKRLVPAFRRMSHMVSSSPTVPTAGGPAPAISMLTLES